MKVEDLNNLIDTYGAAIYGFCWKLTLTKEDADDLYQQTFLRALEICDKIDMDNNPKGFLISIAVNHWKNHISKKYRRQRIIPIEQESFENYSNNVSDNVLIEDEIQNLFLRKKVAEIVTLLPEKFKIPVIMYYTAEMPIENISKALKLPQGTVKSRLYKARGIVKQKLEACGYE